MEFGVVEMTSGVMENAGRDLSSRKMLKRAIAPSISGPPSSPSSGENGGDLERFDFESLSRIFGGDNSLTRYGEKISSRNWLKTSSSSGIASVSTQLCFRFKL